MNNELKDVAPERLQFTKDLLNLYDISINSTISGSAFTKIKDFVTREQIINHGKTGEGMTVVNYADGNPALALFNCNANVLNNFKNMVDIMNAYDSNYLKSLQIMV